MEPDAPKNPFETLLGLRSSDSDHIPPTLAEWLSLDVARLREAVSSARVSIVAPGDGTRRFVLLRSGGEPVNAKRYFDIAGAGLRDMLARLFDHGLETVLCPLLPPSAFSRGEAYITQGLRACHALLAGCLLYTSRQGWHSVPATGECAPRPDARAYPARSAVSGCPRPRDR